ncbi:hypothetical protein [Candidatus Terasakiella magnetica]|uniref:hypothetical protein n=1 Tax=Candidatus Terasakiella magnetica TaxID=1867952 RepID=UPI000F81B3D2|nr:hypothetical protein [Candidatus Terasakiella magnetica]
MAYGISILFGWALSLLGYGEAFSEWFFALSPTAQFVLVGGLVAASSVYSILELIERKLSKET